MQYHAHLQYGFLKLHNANLPVYVSFYIIREIVHKQSLCTSHMNGKNLLSKLYIIFDIYKTDWYHGELDIYTNQLQQFISTCQVCYLEISDVKYQNVLLYILNLYMQSSVCYRHHIRSKSKHYGHASFANASSHLSWWDTSCHFLSEKRIWTRSATCNCNLLQNLCWTNKRSPFVLMSCWHST